MIALARILAGTITRSPVVAKQRDERLRHATPAELLSLVGDPPSDLGHLNLVVEEPAERLMPAVYVPDSDRSSEPALRDEVGKDITLGRHDRKPGPEVVKQACPKRESCLDIIEMRRHADVGLARARRLVRRTAPIRR